MARRKKPWDFDAIKARVQDVAELCRQGVQAEQPAVYFRGLDTELKALRCWVDVDREQRGVREIGELRELVAQLDQRVAELHAGSGNTRTPDPTGSRPAVSWRQ